MDVLVGKNQIHDFSGEIRDLDIYHVEGYISCL